MIISRKHRLIFSHNPKVAGSAVRQVLASLHDHHIEFWHQNWYGEFGRVMDMAHIPIHDLGHALDVHGYKILVMVRDPYARFMSSIAEHCRQHEVILEDAATMNAWVHKHADEINFRFNWKYIHFCPQHYFVGTKCEVKVIKFDLPEAGWAEAQRWLSTHFGIIVGDLPIVRSSNDVGYRSRFLEEDLDEKSISLINSIYHKDFEYFGYVKRTTDTHPPYLAGSHYDRINSIHNPNLQVAPVHMFNPGELKAYNKKYH
jgi:hypothetical protein